MTKRSETTAKALVTGSHRDPFGYLGMHCQKDGVMVRAFLPRASAVSVIEGQGDKVLGVLKRVHADGIFAGILPGCQELCAYRLRVTGPEGEYDLEDPYRFGSSFGEVDLHLLGEGTHLDAYHKMGAHPVVIDHVVGTRFAVWAPNARRVSVVGDFNSWDGRIHPMRLHPGCGIWEIFIPGVGDGSPYKFELLSQEGHKLALKADPYGFLCETPPKTASIVHCHQNFDWLDQTWMAEREARHRRDAPMSIYEVHLGSWRRKPEEDNRYLTYREIADQMVSYVADLGFTHIELMPVNEHPFDGSWGYQPVCLFAPTSRFGTPEDFKYFVNKAHEAGIGIILDWVVGHFPEDPHGLVWFDGSHIYEHADPRQGRHQDWGTLIYNYGRSEVSNYLLANALFWLDEFHIDGLRVDAVASMLYLDYSREEGQWIPNRFGGRENLEAIDFLRRLNEIVYAHHPGAITIAEESTAWPMVSRPTWLGGLGFGYKWNMGWMNDTLDYISKDPVHRKYHHNDLTFGLLYAFEENFILPISHDEVVHGKGSLINRMPGDKWQKCANLRAYLTFMFTQPGKKLLFMGQEFGQESEWNHNDSLDWHLLQYPEHAGLRQCVRDLAHLYRSEPALHQRDCESSGFRWIDCNDSDNSTITWLRQDEAATQQMLISINFTPVVRESYRIGVPRAGYWRQVFNSDSEFYGGGNVGNDGVEAEPIPSHGFDWSIELRLPPLAGVILKSEA